VEPHDPEEPEQRPPDDGDDDDAFRALLPPDDRIWRHPSEVLHGVPAPEPPAAVAPRRGHHQTVAVALASTLAGFVLAVGVLGATGALTPEPGLRETVVRETRAILPAATRASEASVVRIAAEVSPAVVRIEVRGDLDGSGSGVVFRSDGHVLTNAHVVDEAERIMVVMSDGSTYEAERVGVDDVTDIAVVKVTRAEPFPTAVLGSADGLDVGQPTVAIGSPLGLLGGSSVTTGVVSALGREVDGPDGASLLDMIQTDAAIAPGSSGGALLDMRGTVIGITTAIAVSQVGAEGLGFAVPVDLAVRIGSQIIAGGRAVHVWLGIEGRDLDVADAADAGLRGGAVVTEVSEDSPADEVGLLADDVIVALDGEPVPTMSALVVRLRERAPGDVVGLTVLRDGVELPVEATLQERRP
jgi:S1-C subfamily serine protease